ncbi:hypothetical protein P692DRAFT_20757570 [Suillus brevipes Sb2]|nr:hypothetical protein P692DRAFT_20757570 [Suillus brevipes Sb2]
MILLLYAVISCIPFVCASLPSLNDTYIHTLDSSTCSPCNTRTLWDILWSCGLTLFACTWTAVHPDIPGVDDGVVRKFFSRLGLMIMTLFAPEVTISWAVAQFLGARDTANKFNDAIDAPCAHDRRAICMDSDSAVMLLGDIPNSSRSSRARWTLVHGFFAVMGGFVLYVDGEPRARLIPSELLDFVHEGSVEMPTITEAEIKDRSKGDGISKCVAILQLVWFVIQFIARYAQGLPVTLLEIDTMGIAALACIAYGFWWKKPKDIGRPYIVHWKSEVIAPRRGSLAREYRPGKRRSYVSSSMRIEVGDDEAAYTTLIILCVSGMMFGGIHCLGWNYLFQAHEEQILWRVASVGLASSPITFVILSIFFIDWFGATRNINRYWLANVVTNVGLEVYVFSRITIFVLMFLSLLRSLPPGAYDTVAWTMHIPHVNL